MAAPHADLEHARTDSNFRLCDLRGYAAFPDTRQAKQASLNVDREILRRRVERSQPP